MLGPGKYDDVCTMAREFTGGSVLLIVLDGKEGSGFACQATPEHTFAVPGILKAVARMIEDDLKK